MMMRLALLLMLLPLLGRAQSPTPPSPEAPALVKQLLGFDEELAARARRRLLELGPAALSALRAAAEDAEGTAKAGLAELIERIEAQRALQATDSAGEREHVEASQQARLLREHWAAFRARYLEGKLERARELGREGQPTAAIALLDALTVLEPDAPSAMRQKIASLRRELKAERFRRDGVAGDVEAEKSVLRWGAPLELAFTLRNPGGKRFVLKAGDERQRGTIEIDVRFADHTIDGRIQVQRRQHSLPLEADITLDRGQRWRRPWRLPQPKAASPGHIYREIELRARMVPRSIDAGGGAADQTSVTYPLQRYRIFPAGFERHAARPLRSLAGAIKLDQADAIFVSALLVPLHRQREAVDLLVAALDRRQPATTATAVALLERLTGERFEQTGGWPLWWRANRDRFKPRQRWTR